jgi:hypothetical protein
MTPASKFGSRRLAEKDAVHPSVPPSIVAIMGK